MDTGVLRQLHANLDARLQPFWSSKLDNRIVRIKLYAQPDHSSGHNKPESPIPIAEVKAKTNPQGYFSHKFTLTFEELCTHDQTLGLAFAEQTVDYNFRADAELLPAVYALDSSTTGAEASREIQTDDDIVRAETELPLTAAHIRLISDVDDTVKISEVLMGVRAIFHNVGSGSNVTHEADVNLIQRFLSDTLMNSWCLVCQSGFRCWNHEESDSTMWYVC
jgi:phosphatidate phosphatase APP1